MALDAETRDQLVETVRRFVSERLRPLEAQVSENDAIPDDVIEEMKALGLFGLSIPAEYGGLDLGMEEEVLVALELGRTSPAFRSAFGTNVGIGAQGLVMFGNDAQKAKYLPGIASGEIITSFALTEPEAGSDSAAVQTRAVRDGDHYVLNGAKRYITNANKADLFTVMARTDPSKPGGGGVSAFLVERNLPGLSVGKPEKKMGQQGAHICDVIFDNVRVPVANRVGEEGKGWTYAKYLLEFERGGSYSARLKTALGTARRIAGASVRRHGAPLAQDVGFRRRLAALEAELDADRLARWRAEAESVEVSIRLPRFRLRDRLSAERVLRGLGVGKLFEFGTADLTGMTPTERLAVGAVLHEAFVEVDEEGTVAAAATVVITNAPGPPPPRRVEFRADRPFVFLIRDVHHGTILFLGRYTGQG